MKGKKGSREGGKNKVMEAKHKKAKVMGMKEAIYINLKESMADIQRGRLVIDKSGLNLYKSHAKYMAERKAK